MRSRPGWARTELDEAGVTVSSVWSAVSKEVALRGAFANGGDGRLQLADSGGGVSRRSVRRRLPSVSGLFAYLHARGDVAIKPVPRGLPTRRERRRPRQGVPLVRSNRTLLTILSPAEVGALLAAPRTHRDRAMVLAGLRRTNRATLRA